MTARTALWRVTVADGRPAEYTRKQDALEAAGRHWRTSEEPVTTEAYNPFTGQWDPWETQ